MNGQHEPTEECLSVHCYSHMVDEEGSAYIGCYECGHLYRTAGALRRAYRREVLRLPGHGIPFWWRLWRALTIRASQITFCQQCIHDF